MKSRSIYLKNFMFLCGTVLASFLIFGIAFIILMRSYVIDERKDSMYSTASQVNTFISSTGIDSSNEYLNININVLMNITGNNIIIADSDGVITHCSDDFYCEHIGEQIENSVLKTISSQGNFSGQGSLGGLYTTAHYIVGLPIQNKATNEIAGYLILSSDASDFADLWRSFAAMFVFVGIIVVVISFFIAMVMARWQTAPMREMAIAANKFAHGEFSARVAGRNRTDELGELIDSFNGMADALEKSETLRRDFIANVSHELKTPMTSINGFAEGILDGTIPRDRQDEYLGIIASETKRLSRLVRGMLDSSKVQAADRQTVLSDSFDIAEVMRRILLSMENRINAKKLDVEAEIPDEPVKVKGQEDSIMQVVNNLLDNGIKFSDVGGAIGLGISKNNGKIYVSVKNTGDTIPAEELPLIFDRFHKTDRSRSLDKDGVGLGLHIVKTLINNHGENIYVKSENHVTEFLFTLAPADKETAE